MLYAFHRQQSARKPGSIHATYLLTGILPPPEPPVTLTVNGHGNASKKDGEDDVMQSSPFVSSAPQKEEEDDEEEEEEPVRVTSVMLTREEDLDRRCTVVHERSIV